jgi:hypothetical protein
MFSCRRTIRGVACAKRVWRGTNRLSGLGYGLPEQFSQIPGLRNAISRIFKRTINENIKWLRSSVLKIMGSGTSITPVATPLRTLYQNINIVYMMFVVLL